MSTPKHTPTPWEVNTLAGSPYSEGFSNDTLIFDCRPSGLQYAEIEANAEFIVRACNSHDALIADMKHIVEYWNGSVNMSAMEDALNHIIEVAQAAIKLAEEGQ